MQEGYARPGAGAEVPTETEMYPCKNTVEDIPADILASKQHYLRAVRKQAYNRLCQKLYRADFKGAEADTYYNGVSKCFYGTVRFAGADILCR